MRTRRPTPDAGRVEWDLAMSETEKKILEVLESLGGRADEYDLFQQAIGGLGIDESYLFQRTNPDWLKFDVALQRLHLKGRVRCVAHGGLRRGKGRVNVMGLPSVPAWELV